MIAPESLEQLADEFGDVVGESHAALLGMVKELEARIGDLCGEVRTLREQLAVIPAGKDGRDGVNGSPGPRGEVGPSGERGEKGPGGVPGDRGEKGEPGGSGSRGEPGMAGEKGADGMPGAAGASGPAGIDGKDGGAGRDGRDGAKGDPGRDGKDGKDGITLAEVKTAAHDIAIDMLRSIEVDGREWKLGDRIVHMPAWESQGTWQRGAEYATGDVVAWDGSSWVNKEAPSRGEPGHGETSWQLVAKRGRDASKRPVETGRT